MLVRRVQQIAFANKLRFPKGRLWGRRVQLLKFCSDRLHENIVKGIMQQMVRGVAAMHRANVLHRVRPFVVSSFNTDEPTSDICVTALSFGQLYGWLPIEPLAPFGNVSVTVRRTLSRRTC